MQSLQHFMADWYGRYPVSYETALLYCRPDPMPELYGLDRVHHYNSLCDPSVPARMAQQVCSLTILNRYSCWEDAQNPWYTTMEACIRECQDSLLALLWSCVEPRKEPFQAGWFDDA